MNFLFSLFRHHFAILVSFPTNVNELMLLDNDEFHIPVIWTCSTDLVWARYLTSENYSNETCSRGKLFDSMLSYILSK